MKIQKGFSEVLFFTYFAFTINIKASDNNSNIYSFSFRNIPQTSVLNKILENPFYTGRFHIAKMLGLYYIIVDICVQMKDEDEKAYYELEEMVFESGNERYIKRLDEIREFILKPQKNTNRPVT